MGDCVVKVKLVRDTSKVPLYATDGSGCFDLIADIPEATSVVAEGVFPTGIALELPKDHVMLVFSRSGMGFRHGIRLANCVGVIDSDFTDEVMVKLHADRWDHAVHPGDRIAQGLIVPRPKVTFMQVSHIEATSRTGGFGSTGR